MGGSRFCNRGWLIPITHKKEKKNVYFNLSNGVAKLLRKEKKGTCNSSNTMRIKILQEHFFPEKCDRGDSMWALACEQVLRGRNRNESLQLRLWNLNSPSNFPMAPH